MAASPDFPQSPSSIDYLSGVFSGTGRLGMFSHELNYVKKTRSRHGIHQFIAAIAEDSGPLPGGSHASDIAIDSITDFFESPVFTEMQSPRENPAVEEMIRKLFADIGFTVYNKGRHEGAQVRLSLTLILLIEDRFYAAHVGTSRILKIIDEKSILQLTEVHSWSSQAAANLGLAQHVVSRDMRNMNIPTLGLEPEVEIQYLMSTIRPGDRLVLASDGISDFVPNQEISVIINSVDTIQGACNRLVALAQERGMRDNGTIVALNIISGETAGKFAKSRSVSGIVEQEETRKKSVWNFIYVLILMLLLAVIGVSSYVGYRYAQQMMYNMGMTPTPAPTATEPARMTEVGTVASGCHYLVKAKESLPLNYFRLNSRKLDETQEKFELTDSFNVLELQPEISGGTYTVTLKINTKARYRVYEGNTRNVIQLYENEVKVFLTQGATAGFTPDDVDGVISVDISGLQSPLRVTFERQNIIMRISGDQSEPANPKPAATKRGGTKTGGKKR